MKSNTYNRSENTKIMFTRQALKDASTSVSYSRGIAYYRGKAVHDIEVHKIKPYVYTVKSIVEGSEPYHVTMNIDIKNDAITSAGCTCPYNYGGICKHIVATGLAFMDHMAKADETTAEQDSSISFNKLIKDFKQSSDNPQPSDTQSYAIKLRIVNSAKSHLLLYIPKELEQIDSALLPWRYATLISYLAKAYRYSDGSFGLSGTILDKVLDLLSSFDNVFAFDGQTAIKFSNDYFKPMLDIKQAQNENMTITVRSDNPVFFGRKSAYTIQDDTIMRLWPHIPLSFYKALYENKGYINISQRDVPSFVEDIFPRLKHQLPVTAPALPEIEQRPIQPEVHIYLRRGDAVSSIILEAFLEYESYVSQRLLNYSYYSASTAQEPYRVKEGEKVLVIPRQYELEITVNERLMRYLWYGIDPEHGHLEFSDQERIYRFIKDFDSAILPEWKIHYEDGLQNLKLEKAKVAVDFDFSMDDDYDLMEFDVDFHCKNLNITRDQLEQYIKEDQRFIEVNGKFVEISNKNELKELFDTLSRFTAQDEQRFRSKLFNFPELDRLIEKNRAWNAKGDNKFLQFKDEIKNAKPIEDIPLSQPFDNILRQYQKDGISWMYFLKKYGFGGILADDMGLGKTLQALVLISANHSDRPSLVICPKTLVYNWYNEVQKFTPQLKTLIIEGQSTERIQLINDIKHYDLIITSYPVIQKDIEYLADKTFEYCIIDEAQYIKNHKTKTAKSIKAIRANHRLALTGTPIENNLMELWSIFDFLMPGFLGSDSEFKARYDTPIMKNNDISALNSLLARIRPFVLRRTKKEMLKELPPKMEQVSYAHLTPDQLALYTSVLEQVKSNVFAIVEQKGFEHSQIEILAALTRLRQICNHPALLTINTPAITKKLSSGKLDQFDELLDEALEGDHKVLVFSQFVQMLGILSNHLDKKGIPYCYLDGQTRNRQAVIDRFNNDENIKVFLISIKAGGFGLNLTAADTVIIFDPWWNPMVEMQATDRAYRMGQTHPVNVYRLITRGTIEEKILKLQEKKKALFDNVVDENNDLIKKLTWDDIREVFA
ncbi:MAG: SNF2-related protein [Mahella sp.]|nr:SNF2-related protein [Mahella sp.]